MVVGYPLGYLFLGVPGYIAKTKLISLIVLPHDLAIAINLIDHIILRIALIVLPYLRCCRVLPPLLTPQLSDPLLPPLAYQTNA